MTEWQLCWPKGGKKFLDFTLLFNTSLGSTCPFIYFSLVEEKTADSSSTQVEKVTWLSPDRLLQRDELLPWMIPCAKLTYRNVLAISGL